MESQEETIIRQNYDGNIINNCEIKSSSEIYLIKQKISENYNEITKCRKTIKKSQNDIETLKDTLYELCQHTFIRDFSAAPDDIYKYYCKKCHLYRH